MPDDECPKKEKMKAEAIKALAELEKVTDEKPDLVPKLKLVKQTLEFMKMDNHRQ
jgi:hypothetical protein